MSKESTFLRVLRDLDGAFVREKSQRPSGDMYTHLRDGSPSWMTDAIFSAHEALGGRLPDDWTYEACRHIVSSLIDHLPDDQDEATEAVHEIADGCVDVYNSARSQWLADHLGNAALVDEACEELGTPADADLFTRIGLGQFLACERIAGALIDAIGAVASDMRDAFADQISTIATEVARQ